MKFSKDFEKQFVQAQEEYLDIFVKNLVLNNIENECIDKVLEENIFLDKRGNKINNHKQSFRMLRNDMEKFKSLLFQEKINYGLINQSKDLKSTYETSKKLKESELNLFNLGLNTIPINERKELTEIYNNDLGKKNEILSLMSKVKLSDI
jgi:hypothetical protein